jgi:arsenate-mycothiol transferase
VLFVCVKNSGKSRITAGRIRAIAGHSVHVYSAGTRAGTSINRLSLESLAEVGVDISDQTPRPIGPIVVRDVDFVITLGRQAHVDPVPGPRFETWDTDEPSQRGIDGIERMRRVRDDITDRVTDLLRRIEAASVSHNARPGPGGSTRGGEDAGPLKRDVGAPRFAPTLLAVRRKEAQGCIPYLGTGLSSIYGDRWGYGLVAGPRGLIHSR